MIRILPFAIELILVIFCLIDCVQAQDHRVRNLPKWGWILLMILVPIIGCIAWLVAGRPVRSSTGREVPWPSKTAGYPEHERPVRHPLAPDDDPEFLRSLKKGNQEHEDLLKKWEEDLKRREEDLKKDQNPTSDEPPA